MRVLNKFSLCILPLKQKTKITLKFDAKLDDVIIQQEGSKLVKKQMENKKKKMQDNLNETLANEVLILTGK